MLKDNIDRRIIRSTRMLKNSMLSLLKEKSFNDISAKDITEHADLNRGTFYLHYQNTKDLLSSIENDIIADVQNLIDEHIKEVDIKDSLNPMLSVLLDEIVRHQETLYILLKNSDASQIIDKLQSLIYKNGLELAERKFNFKSIVQTEYYLNYISFGILGIIKLWCDSDMNVNKEILLDYCTSLAMHSAESILNI